MYFSFLVGCCPVRSQECALASTAAAGWQASREGGGIPYEWLAARFVYALPRHGRFSRKRRASIGEKKEGRRERGGRTSKGSGQSAAFWAAQFHASWRDLCLLRVGFTLTAVGVSQPASKSHACLFSFCFCFFSKI